MIEQTNSLYKLIILQILSKVNFPLSAAQIAEFMVEHRYTTFFRLQEVIADMVDTGLLQTKTENHVTYYSATEQGQDTLRFFNQDIHDDIKDEIAVFIKNNGYEMRMDSSVKANYHWLSDQGYEVHCTVSEGNENLVDLRMTVATEEAARTICNNWYHKNADVYASLMGILLSD